MVRSQIEPRSNTNHFSRKFLRDCRSGRKRAAVFPRRTALQASSCRRLLRSTAGRADGPATIKPEMRPWGRSCGRCYEGICYCLSPTNGPQLYSSPHAHSFPLNPGQLNDRNFSELWDRNHFHCRQLLRLHEMGVARLRFHPRCTNGGCWYAEEGFGLLLLRTRLIEWGSRLTVLGNYTTLLVGEVART